MPGVGDFTIGTVTPLADPCPLPEADPEKRKLKRSLNAKETLLYAPGSNVGAISMDEDAVYINVPHVHFTRPEEVRRGSGGGAGHWRGEGRGRRGALVACCQ